MNPTRPALRPLLALVLSAAFVAGAAQAQNVAVVNGKPVLSLPASTRALLRADETDNVYFHVVSREGKVLAGDRELPTPDLNVAPDALPGDIYFRDVELNGQDVRVAYSYVADGQMPRERWVLVEVGVRCSRATSTQKPSLPQWTVVSRWSFSWRSGPRAVATDEGRRVC